ncbi:hypothetical protein [Halosimplex halophilum]|uniref:hypothetical protein n=1 Tax=Halosimplex halophilum TaxID=2559572 RepID=UPI00107EFDAB|nr:hypothetical protein [Halosimplex halophilum]
MSAISRREMLAATGLAVSGGLAGCLLRQQGPGTGHIYIENTDETAHRVALWVAQRSVDDAATPGETGAVGATGTDGGTGSGEGTGDVDPIVAAWYRVPEGDAVEFQNVIEPGQGYEVRAALPDAPPADRITGVVDPCSGEAAGERVVSVRVRPDGLGIIPWGCEDTYTKGDMEYVDAGERRIEPVEGTVAAPST